MTAKRLQENYQFCVQAYLQEKGIRYFNKYVLQHADLDGTGPGGPNGSRETVAGYLPPSVIGESWRPVPTAASVAAPDPGLLAWAASSLRRSSHGRAGSRHTGDTDWRRRSAGCVARETSPHGRVWHKEEAYCFWGQTVNIGHMSATQEVFLKSSISSDWLEIWRGFIVQATEFN